MKRELILEISLLSCACFALRGNAQRIFLPKIVPRHRL